MYTADTPITYNVSRLFEKLGRAYYDGRHYLNREEVLRILEECAVNAD